MAGTILKKKISGKFLRKHFLNFLCNWSEKRGQHRDYPEMHQPEQNQGGDRDCDREPSQVYFQIRPAHRSMIQDADDEVYNNDFPRCRQRILSHKQDQSRSSWETNNDGCSGCENHLECSNKEWASGDEFDMSKLVTFEKIEESNRRDLCPGNNSEHCMG